MSIIFHFANVVHDHQIRCPAPKLELGNVSSYRVDIGRLLWELFDKEGDFNQVELFDLVIMTFFLEARNKLSNEPVYDVATVMLRGNRVFITEYNK